MDSYNDFESRMNNLLDDSEFNASMAETMLKSACNDYQAKIRLVDFEYFNEERLAQAREQKKLGIENMRFEKAAANRYLETECARYIELRKQFGFEKSMFHFDDNYLFYLHFGNQPNDEKMKKIISGFINE